MTTNTPKELHSSHKLSLEHSWNICQSHIYLACPIYDDDWNIVNFDVDFRRAVDIFPFEGGWCAEYGSFSLDDKMYYHAHELDIYENTYEDIIITLANWLVDNWGMDLLDDYYVIDESEPFIIEDDGRCVMNSNSYWKIDEILNRIRDFEK